MPILLLASAKVGVDWPPSLAGVCTVLESDARAGEAVPLTVLFEPAAVELVAVEPVAALLLLELLMAELLPEQSVDETLE